MTDQHYTLSQTSNLLARSQQVIKPIEHSELSHVKLTSVNSGFEMDVKH